MVRDAVGTVYALGYRSVAVGRARCRFRRWQSWATLIRPDVFTKAGHHELRRSQARPAAAFNTANGGPRRRSPPKNDDELDAELAALPRPAQVLP